ncbi:MAG: Lrp/AsnC family transcriptional regulator [Phycisphaerae bacterium]|nr:Lrp/AsnC family transcriptional regulator [Phycisphaerae bacterium]
MKTPLSSLERDILSAVQYGMPVSRSPYRDIADKIGISPEELLEKLREWKAEKKIRRLGAIVNHFQMGHGAGAMVVWKVPKSEVDRVGDFFAMVPKVSHAYLRPPNEQWPYNLYTMVHASSDKELQETVNAMSVESGITEFRQLKTVRELKKVPPIYIIEL